MPNTADNPANRIGLATDVEGVVDGGHPVLHGVAGASTDDAADEDDQRDFVVVETDFFREALDGEWAVGVDLFVSGFVRGASGVDQVLRRVELGHHAVDGIALRH
jgi:hypothetical protein